MKSSFRSVIRLAAVTAGLAVMSLGFQNCAGKGFEVVNLEEALQQQSVIVDPVVNGLQFKRMAAAGAECGDDGVEAVIEETRTGAIQLLRKDCADLEKPLKLDVYKTAKFAHNPSFLVYEGKLYRLDPASVVLEEGQTPDPELEFHTQAICRNEVNDNGTRRVTDVRVFADGDGKTKAKVLLGEYRSGAVLKTYKSVEMELERKFDEDGVTQDQAVGLAEGQGFALTLVATEAGGVVGEIGFTSGIFGEDAPVVYEAGQTYLSPGMSCYQ